MKPHSIENGGTRSEDEEIADRARMGDTEAFGELIRRHREKAVGWAQGLAQDKSLAEDIVQEAFVKAFLHVGNLMQPDRFVGWLRQIVKNEANMKLRRGGPYRREQPFSSFAVSGKMHPSASGEGMLERWLNRYGHAELSSHTDAEPLQFLRLAAQLYKKTPQTCSQNK